jgi:hypothetical protein
MATRLLLERHSFQQFFLLKFLNAVGKDREPLLKGKAQYS